MNFKLRIIAIALAAVPFVATAQSGTGSANNGTIMSPNTATPASNSTLPTVNSAAPSQMGTNHGAPSADGSSIGTRPTTSGKSMGTATNKTPDASKSGVSNSTNTVDPTTTK